MSEIAIFKDKRILLGVTGSIAAHKAADLASKLTQAGAAVDVVLSEAARQFVSPLTFQSLTGRKTYVDADLWGGEGHVIHVGLALAADVILIAPATANTIAKLAHGQADTLLTLTAIATQAPVLIAPAMDAGMYENPAVRANVDALRERGAVLLGPAPGRMASGIEGLGRLLEPEELMGHVRLALGANGSLVDRRIVVSAGGTREPIDPVRMITNRSSGKQGYALAQASLDRGARVDLVTAPTHLAAPIGAERREVVTAAEMRDAILGLTGQADILLMAAAVADFRPKSPAGKKIKKSKGTPEITLEPTDDILGLVAKQRESTGRPMVVVGFAAESQDLEIQAQEKLKAKSLSLIVANDIQSDDAGFDVDTNRVVLIDSEGQVEQLPLLSKAEVAEAVLDRVEGMIR